MSPRGLATQKVILPLHQFTISIRESLFKVNVSSYLNYERHISGVSPFRPLRQLG